MNKREDASCDSRTKLLTLARDASIGVCITDERGEDLYLNERWCALAGLPATAARNLGWLRTVHPGDRSIVAEGLVESRIAQTKYAAQFRFTGTGGAATWVVLRSHPVADARRRPGGFVAGMQALISPIALEDELLQFTLHAGDRIRSSLGDRQGVQPGTGDRPSLPGALRDAVRNEREDFTGSASACMIHEATLWLRRTVEEIVRSSRLDHSFPR